MPPKTVQIKIATLRSAKKKQRGRGSAPNSRPASAQQRPARLVGKGAYKLAKEESLLRAGNKSLGRAVGEVVGNAFGIPTAISGGAGNLFHRAVSGFVNMLTGKGSYQINSNIDESQSSGLNVAFTGMVPRTGYDDQTHTFKGVEYVGDVTSSSTFTQQRFTINPGLPHTFPVLSYTAAMYEQYEFKQLGLAYVSNTGQLIEAGNSIGYVAMATRYNEQEPIFSSTMEMQASGGAKLPATTNWLHGIECDASKGGSGDCAVKFIRSADASDDFDQQNDSGIITVGVEGCPTIGTKLGELYWTYTVKCFKRKLPLLASPATTASMFHAKFLVSAAAEYSPPMSNAARWVLGSGNDGSPTIQTGSNLGVSLVPGADENSGGLRFPKIAANYVVIAMTVQVPPTRAWVTTSGHFVGLGSTTNPLNLLPSDNINANISDFEVRDVSGITGVTTVNYSPSVSDGYDVAVSFQTCDEASTYTNVMHVFVIPLPSALTKLSKTANGLDDRTVMAYLKARYPALGLPSDDLTGSPQLVSRPSSHAGDYPVSATPTARFYPSAAAAASSRLRL